MIYNVLFIKNKIICEREECINKNEILIAINDVMNIESYDTIFIHISNKKIAGFDFNTLIRDK